MFNKRGISPLIAAVLIIGFVVALAVIILVWGGDFIKTTQETTKATAYEKITCSVNVRSDLKNAELLGDEVNLKIENAGAKDIEKFIVRIYGSDGIANVETSSGLESLEIQTINVTFDPYEVGAIDKVEVFPAIDYNGKTVVCSNYYEDSPASLSDEGLLMHLINGSYINGTIYGATSVEGKYGDALYFDGSNDYVDMEQGLFGYVQDKFTVEAWLKLNTNSIGQIAVYNGWGGEFSLEYGTGTYTFQLATNINGEGWKTVRTSNPYTDLEWHYVVGVYERFNKTTKIYVDGKLENTLELSTTNQLVNPATYHPGTLGAYTAADGQRYTFFNGTIDEVRIYNRSLSYSEIKAHYFGNY